MPESTISPKSGAKNCVTSIIDKFFDLSSDPSPCDVIDAVKKYASDPGEQFHEKP